MNCSDFNQGLLAFLNASPTPYHAVAEMVRLLVGANFTKLNEGETWDCQPGQGYYLTRQDSALIAFKWGNIDHNSHGLRLIGAHTDSPCLKIKPVGDIYQHHYHQLGVETYGSALLHPWFDRDLSIAGRVDFETPTGSLTHQLIDFNKPIAYIPSLAIHLNREANEGQKINRQTDVNPLIALTLEGEQTLASMLMTQLTQQAPEMSIKKILSYDLNCYDTQPAGLVGLNQAFIAGQHLDNLLSCYIALHSLIAADSPQTCVLACYDHEEVGSQSAIGANGHWLNALLARLISDPVKLAQTISRSLLVSLDAAHAIHPNFADRHDQQHAPKMNQGIVIKTNTNQRYATNSESSAWFKQCAQAVDVPTQDFVIRSDLTCGSTIGPISASQTGINTVDVGVPMLAMHSIRELAGSLDALAAFKVLRYFYAY